MSADSPPIRIVVAQCHDRAIARAGLRRLLEDNPHFEIVGDAGNREDVLRLVSEQMPQIVLLDYSCCDDQELRLLAEIIEANEHCRVVVLAGTASSQSKQEAVSAGAMGIVPQEQTATVLFKAIECVHAGEIWFERSLAASVLREKTRPRPQNPNDPQVRIESLNEREREVIVFICEGLKNQAIAEKLFISEATVRHRLTSIFEKLRVSDRLELVIFAYHHGLAQLPR
jgi:DNA-binding NarL/FixJ family response regulator